MKLEILIKRKSALLGLASIYWVNFLQILLGSVFLGLMAQFAIPLPFTPVPLSMQSLGIALLTISLGARKAPLAIAAYLMQATLGMPILAGGVSNPLWMIGPKAGYLIGFVAASYIVGMLLERQKQNSFIKSWLILSLNEGVILLVGTLWLGFFVGWDYAFTMGALPFIPGALIKITIAASSIKPIEWARSKFSHR